MDSFHSVKPIVGRIAYEWTLFLFVLWIVVAFLEVIKSGLVVYTFNTNIVLVAMLICGAGTLLWYRPHGAISNE